MFEKLLDVLSAILVELRRYNEGQGTLTNSDTPTPAAVKPAAAKPAAAKPAAPAVTFPEAQEKAVALVASKGRDILIKVLKDSGVPPVDAGQGPVYKISTVKDDPVALAKVYKGLTAALVEDAPAEPEEDPTA